MMNRFLPLCFAVLALAVLASQPVLAAGEDVHEGMVVKAGGAKLTMTMKGEEKEHTHAVAKDAKITLDGKATKLEELKKGYHVAVTVHGEHGIVKIAAMSKSPKP
jgi:hypothetical protein